MLSHKLVLEDVVDQDYELVAIHASVEEYKIAFLINKYLKLRLSRSRKDIDVYKKSVRALFILYKFQDILHYTDYYLMSNRSIKQITTTAATDSLFVQEEISTSTVFLLPEHSKVDFFLKITSESEIFDQKILIEKLKKIPQVATAYKVDQNKIKSKENLIFD